MIHLAVLVIALVTHASATQHQYQSNQPQAQKIIVNDDLYREFQQWQQSIRQPIEQEEVESQPQPNSVSQYNNDYNNYGGDNNQYGGNPWLPPTPAPAPPPTIIDPNPNPGNHHHHHHNQNGGYYPAPPKPPQQGGYYPPATQPPTQYLPPQTTPYYPPVTQKPASGGYYPPPTATLPPVDPAVASLRKHCLKPRGQFASHYCNKYVNCWDDTVIEQECPAGLRFSEKGYCDYDYNVDCRGRPTHHHEVPTMPAGSKHCSSPFGVFRSNQNCSEFFVCNHGSPVKFCCPSGLYYNSHLGVCDYPHNVHDCVNPRPLYTPELPPPTPIHNNPYYLQRLPADFSQGRKSCVPNSIYRIEADCSSVAICRSGRTEVINCGEHTAYNADSHSCVAKHLALC